MEDYQEKLKLIYKNKIITLKFCPKNYDQLRDTFLSLFREKSYKIYRFKSYLSDQLNNNSIIILREDNKFAESIRRTKLLKNPAIFIYAQDEVDDEDELDKKNVEFIAKKENNLGFEINKNNKEEIINHLKRELEQKLKNLECLQNRVDNLNLAVSKMKKFNDNKINNDICLEDNHNKQYEFF